jgi:hypothetical protein
VVHAERDPLQRRAGGAGTQGLAALHAGERVSGVGGSGITRDGSASPTRTREPGQHRAPGSERPAARAPPPRSTPPRSPRLRGVLLNGGPRNGHRLCVKVERQTPPLLHRPLRPHKRYPLRTSEGGEVRRNFPAGRAAFRPRVGSHWCTGPLTPRQSRTWVLSLLRLQASVRSCAPHPPERRWTPTALSLMPAIIGNTFAASLRTDICPQRQEARPRLTLGIRLILTFLIRLVV